MVIVKQWGFSLFTKSKACQKKKKKKKKQLDQNSMFLQQASVINLCQACF